MRCDADFVGDEDVSPVGDDGRPEDGHRGAHDCETDFEEGDDDDFGVPPIQSSVSESSISECCRARESGFLPNKIETLNRILIMLERSPETQNRHQNSTVKKG